MKNKYSVLPRRIQKYYRQERPKRIISEFMRERFYLPASFVKQLSYADEPLWHQEPNIHRPASEVERIYIF